MEKRIKKITSDRHSGFRHYCFSLMLLFLVLFCSSTFSFAGNLTDIQGHWAEASIEKAIQEGYVKGYPDSTFKPDNVVTRAEFVTMVNAAYQVPLNGTGNDFTDIQTTDWFASDVWSAVEKGYVNGYDDNTFKPNQYIKREEAACLIQKLTKMSGGSKKNFADSAQIDSWAQDAVDTLTLKGIMAGYPDGTFKPTGNLTRAEAVAIIGNALSDGTNKVVKTSLEVTADNVFVRMGPDTLYDVIDKVNQGQVLTATEQSKNGWYKVKFNNKDAWITGKYVKEVDTTNNQNNTDNGTDTQSNTSLVVTADIVNLRAGPDTSYSIVGKAKQGDILIATDQSSNGWYKIQSDNAEAWIIGQYVKTIDDVNRGDSGNGTAYDDGINTITIDAGHGGSDTGAVGVNGLKEKDMNLAIALKVSDYLTQAGFKVIMTRSSDETVSLLHRSEISDNANADVFVAIHCNSATGIAGGTETLVEPLSKNPVYNQQEDSKRLAGLVHNELIQAIGLADRGVKEQDLSVCRETNAPAILVETAFIDNANEAALLADPAFQDTVAQAIAAGISKYFED